ncbi:MAG: DNA helicase RecQ [Planctomycetes bacterium]|nr:DNA helicase RecQ [Planctomycetota bacterium]MBL7145345.1 DNA helicase RecQ [Phycisphaerae bacterium]
MMENIQKALSKYWGYDGFLPLQKQAMECITRRQDSIVVLPTGGGKSLCFQAPAVTMPGLAVVVSPLISLMKDQVDALTECGVSAMRIDSSMSVSERDNVIARINEQTLKLLYLSPERFLSDGFVDFLKKTKLSFIAVDEAHCVSMWGHDFRPEYRQLGSLKQIFPDVTIAAYTATATEHVRNDIAEQLRLKNPQMLIGSFDRPNLVYKVRPRKTILKQVCAVLDRHKGESGIIYCIRRKDVDSMCAQLAAKGYSVVPYHAGMTDEDRKKNQEQFINEKVDTIVATIAFGMGIDKSNVRYVIHTGMPKSLEHYQQESGRAGRDGLEAECCLFYSGGDYGIWKSLMRDMPAEARKIAMIKLSGIYSYCTGGVCRHKAILRYFGQDLNKDNCTACDMCLGELDCIDDLLVTAQKILSCIARLDQRFGGTYTALVLTGSEDKRIIENNHDKLSTYGLLSDYSKHIVHDWIEQLAGQDYIEKSGEYNVLNITEKGWRVLKGTETPRLLKPVERPVKASKIVTDSWEGVDKGLFEALRKLRATIASKKKVPAYVVFGDTTLRDIARRRPSTLDGFLGVKGVGEAKCKQYGEVVLAAIKDYCQTNSLEMDVGATSETTSFDPPTGEPQKGLKLSKARQLAFDMFEQKLSIEEVAKSVNRAESTTIQYLVEYIKRENINKPYPWVDEQTFGRIIDAMKQVGSGRMKPIFDLLNGEIDYNQIRISVACLCNNG